MTWKWKPCQKPDCQFYRGAEAEVSIRGKYPKIAMWLTFDQHEHIGLQHQAGAKYADYPCMFCEHYAPTRFNLYRETKKNGPSTSTE